MESSTILTPLGPAYTVFCFSSEPNIPKGKVVSQNKLFLTDECIKLKRSAGN